MTRRNLFRTLLGAMVGPWLYRTASAAMVVPPGATPEAIAAADPKARCESVSWYPATGTQWNVEMDYSDGTSDRYVFTCWVPEWSSVLLRSPRVHNRWAVSEMVVSSQLGKAAS